MKTLLRRARKQETVRPDILLGQIPASIAASANAIGLTPDTCLFSIRSDMDLSGRPCDAWLVVGRDRMAAFTADQLEVRVLSGPFEWRKATKIRNFQTVGSMFLQLRLEDMYVDVIRFSNGFREAFGRAVVQLQRMLRGEPLSREALAAPSETICGTCGLPLPGLRAQCPRCSGRRGIVARTLALMRPYWWSIFLLLAMMVMGVLLDLIPPQLTRYLVDQVLKPGTGGEVLSSASNSGFQAFLNRLVQGSGAWTRGDRMSLLVLILACLVTASAARHTLNIFIGRISSLIGTRITKELRERLHRHLLRLSVDYYNRHSAGNLMSRVLYDVDYFQGFVAQVAHGFLLNVMLVLGIGTVLFVMNPRLALVVLLPIPFVVVGTTFFWRHIYPRYYRLWDSQSKMAQLLTGFLQGIRLVKAFSQEERERARFSSAAGYMQQARRSVEMGMATFNPIMGFVFGLGGLLIWFAGGERVLRGLNGEPGGITLGTLMAFFGYMGMFYGPISQLTMFSNWVTGFLSAGQRVFEVLDSVQSLPEDPKPVRLSSLKGAIELRNVTFGYDPYHPILKNVSMTIEAGRFVGIVGKSGSGKTTLVNVICRFYDVQQGAVLIDGVDVRKIATEDLHRHIGLVLQEPFLFRASIAENIAYGRPDAPPSAIMDAAKAANAHDFIARRPNGYDMKLGENGSGLSGGERQRVSIARALLCDPRILILDEATSSVDTESELEIQKALTHLCKGRTTLAIAHRLSTLKNADWIYVMDDGRIAEEGTHEELLARDGIYSKLVKIQTELTRLEA
jgi:ATP-binding cassette subfamily B protein